MSQNFSKMSDNYIPELMELDSYWQKAVEDAICDTLKGEKRLFYALRNRKKIKQKLEMLGMKASNMNTFAPNMSKSRLDYPEDKESSESSFGRSMSWLEDESQKRDSRLRSSWSKSKGEASTEERLKSPDRTILGNGSLEKLKKSQNSFNGEPMGYDNTNPDLSDSENGDERDLNEGVEQVDGNKKVQWLHVRKDSDFECSDSESVSNSGVCEAGEGNNDFLKSNSVKDKNYFISKKLGFRLPVTPDMRHEERLSSRSDSQWDTESEDAIPLNPDLERRLQLALAKREILNDNLKAMSIGTNHIQVEVQGSVLKLVEQSKKSKSFLPPFLRFYLEVYRELCHKCSVKEIAEEARKRWWNMSAKQRSTYKDFLPPP